MKCLSTEKAPAATLAAFLVVVQICFATIFLGEYRASIRSKHIASASSHSTLDTDTDDELYAASSKSSKIGKVTLDMEVGTIPLHELVETNPSNTMECGPGSVKIEDFILPQSISHAGRKIPRVVHITSKTRCSTSAIKDHVAKWRFENHTVVYHDDAAVHRLLRKYWPEFPHLQMTMHCLKSGAAFADLWRYLVLWEYGGIYSDVDTGPSSLFNASTISPNDDSWFTVESLGIISQYFMAASPRHPLMYLSVMHTLFRLFDVSSVRDQYVPYVTGPGALKNAFIDFMGAKGTKLGDHYQRQYQGIYVGMDNRTVTVVGSHDNQNLYIDRYGLGRRGKKKGYQMMNQTHFGSTTLEENLNISCFQHLYHLVAKSLNNSQATLLRKR